MEVDIQSTLEECYSEHYTVFCRQIIYGIKVQPKNDHYITTAETAMFGMTVAGNSGTFLVDTIPMCKSLFSFFPSFAHLLDQFF